MKAKHFVIDERPRLATIRKLCLLLKDLGIGIKIGTAEEVEVDELVFRDM